MLPLRYEDEGGAEQGDGDRREKNARLIAIAFGDNVRSHLFTFGLLFMAAFATSLVVVYSPGQCHFDRYETRELSYQTGFCESFGHLIARRFGLVEDEDFAGYSDSLAPLWGDIGLRILLSAIVALPLFGIVYLLRRVSGRTTASTRRARKARA